MRKLASILALVFSVVMFAVAIYGYYDNRRECSELSALALSDTTLEVVLESNASILRNTQHIQLLKEEAGGRGDAMAVELAREKYETSKKALGSRSSKEDVANIRRLDQAVTIYLWEGIAAAAFLIASLVLFSRKPERDEVPATA